MRHMPPTPVPLPGAGHPPPLLSFHSFSVPRFEPPPPPPSLPPHPHQPHYRPATLLPHPTRLPRPQQGEDVTEAAEREVLEETGVRARFAALLALRQAHGFAHGKSDLFFVVALQLEPGPQVGGWVWQRWRWGACMTAVVCFTSGWGAGWPAGGKGDGSALVGHQQQRADRACHARQRALGQKSCKVIKQRRPCSFSIHVCLNPLRRSCACRRMSWWA
jgi:ADP-ribose pyrophosphatase YjhB (NUDIX family)